MLQRIKRWVKQRFCFHAWMERSPTPTERQVFTVGYRFWLCKECGAKAVREWNDLPISYSSASPPMTEHYESLRQGLEPYRMDFEYKTPEDCMAHILYDILIWARCCVGQDKFIPALKKAHEMAKAYHLQELEWIETERRRHGTVV